MTVLNDVDMVPRATRGPRRYEIRNNVGSDDSSFTYRSSRYGYDSHFESDQSQAFAEIRSDQSEISSEQRWARLSLSMLYACLNFLGMPKLACA